MKTLLTSAAFAALLAATPAFAADDAMNPVTANPPAAATDNGAVTPADPMNPAPAATDNAATPDAMAPANTAEAPAVAPNTEAPAVVAVAPSSDYIGQQPAGDQLASNWIGQTIYNAADENVGDVNDLIIGDNGQISGVVIGVGGFLGIGEKNVGVPFSAITASTDADGNVKLMIQATKDQLDAAPEFQTLADLKAAQPAEAPIEPAPVQ